MIFITLALVIFGLVMLASASSVTAYQKFGSSNYLLWRQFLYGVLPGWLFLVILAKIDYHRLEKLAFPLLLMSIVLLILVFMPGTGVELKGAKRWLDFGLVFQPTEVLKLTFVIYLAAWLSKCIREKQFLLTSFLTILAVISFLVVSQPDVGTLFLLMVLAVGVYFAAGAPLKQILAILVLALVTFGLLIKIAPYRLSRLVVFLNPEIDPQGSGYQINQALLAIGSGGFWGLGLGQSRQKYNYLPEVVGDSIFAVIAEELGFIGVIALITLFVLLAFLGFKIAKSARDDFGRLAACGITIWLVFQAFVNMGAMVGLLPLTGIPLPFISLGGTALTVSLASIGILINIARQSR